MARAAVREVLATVRGCLAALILGFLLIWTFLGSSTPEECAARCKVRGMVTRDFVILDFVFHPGLCLCGRP